MSFVDRANAGRRYPRDEEITMSIGGTMLRGQLTIPDSPTGLVIIAHASGNSRRSPRNRQVATALNVSGLGTVQFDLLTPDEEAQRAQVFDIESLAHRLVEVTRRLRARPEADGSRVGYLGAGTGAAAALWAATEIPDDVNAIVSQGGRPDLATPRLRQVTTPTLLIVGSRDLVVLELNRRARQSLSCENEFVVVPDATHTFDQPGCLNQAAELARDWFLRHLAPNRQHTAHRG